MLRDASMCFMLSMEGAPLKKHDISTSNQHIMKKKKICIFLRTKVNFGYDREDTQLPLLKMQLQPPIMLANGYHSLYKNQTQFHVDGGSIICLSSSGFSPIGQHMHGSVPLVYKLGYASQLRSTTFCLCYSGVHEG